MYLSLFLDVYKRQPYDDGHVAWHCAEIPFVFHNADKVPVCNLPGVSDQMCIRDRV